nr:hypothetical protein GCM10020093_046880 [Planobispora longispora]
MTVGRLFRLAALLAAALAAPDAITEVDLSGERLHRLPEAPGTLTGLVRLTLQDTPLTGLDGIGGAHRLQWLSIRKTPVESLAPLLTLPHLTYLDVSYCAGVTDWPILADLPGLQTAVAHGCRLPDQLRRGRSISASSGRTPPAPGRGRS